VNETVDLESQARSHCIGKSMLLSGKKHGNIVTAVPTPDSRGQSLKRVRASE